jgi:hypothetical protein
MMRGASVRAINDRWLTLADELLVDVDDVLHSDTRWHSTHSADGA